jgi:hypothetical protein
MEYLLSCTNDANILREAICFLGSSFRQKGFIQICYFFIFFIFYFLFFIFYFLFFIFYFLFFIFYFLFFIFYFLFFIFYFLLFFFNFYFLFSFILTHLFYSKYRILAEPLF